MGQACHWPDYDSLSVGAAWFVCRYQRRALAWMMWREQQQQQQRAPAGSISSNNSSSSTDYAQAAAGVLGTQLLNPLWTQVVLTVPQQQQQQLVLYHAPSHGLVSLQQPAPYVGHAGGMLCDEMGKHAGHGGGGGERLLDQGHGLKAGVEGGRGVVPLIALACACSLLRHTWGKGGGSVVLLADCWGDAVL